MPSTATIEAMPIAIPSADSAARSAAGAQAERAGAQDVGGGHASRASTTPSRSVDRARGKRGGDLVVVGDHDDRRAGRVQLVQQREDVLAGAAVEVAGRLVGEHDRRPPEQRAGDRDPLALAARQLRRARASSRCPRPTRSSASRAARPPLAPAPAPA